MSFADNRADVPALVAEVERLQTALAVERGMTDDKPFAVVRPYDDAIDGVWMRDALNKIIGRVLLKEAQAITELMPRTVENASEYLRLVARHTYGVKQ